MRFGRLIWNPVVWSLLYASALLMGCSPRRSREPAASVPELPRDCLQVSTCDIQNATDVEMVFGSSTTVQLVWVVPESPDRYVDGKGVLVHFPSRVVDVLRYQFGDRPLSPIGIAESFHAGRTLRIRAAAWADQDRCLSIVGDRADMRGLAAEIMRNASELQDSIEPIKR